MSEDPTQVDTVTLLKSLARDVEEGQAKAMEAYRWFSQARITAHELKRRFEDVK